jgi:hypothetical protein
LEVEQLPDERWKGALAIKLNSFILGNVILRNTVNGYSDSFGILGIALENETVLKLKPELQLLPSFRFYAQKASRYFDEFMRHNPDEEYFTSDFDLSRFQTYTAGLGVKLNPRNRLIRKVILNTLVFRYNFMYRTNGLRAHTVSLVFQTEKNKN